MIPGSLDIRAELRHLMVVCDADPRLGSENSRARREFFAADEPLYAVGDAALEAAEIRFAEWFLLERENDNLGVLPLNRFREHAEDLEAFELLSDSLCSMFIVESGKSERPRVRDLQGGQRHDLTGVPDPLRSGDILVGRIFEAGTGAHVPSCAMAILAASPQVAVAFQKDLKGLGVDRRLTQSELEHLLFRRWGEAALARSNDTAKTMPVELIEADLERLFEQAGVAEDYSATDLSTAIKRIKEPGMALAEFMDQIAFDTDIDLERMRGIMTDLWAAHHPQGGAKPGSSSAKESEPKSSAPKANSEASARSRTEAPSDAKPKAAQPDGDGVAKSKQDNPSSAPSSPPSPVTEPQPGFMPIDVPIKPEAQKPGAGRGDDRVLGSRIAARLEQGLDGKEDIDALFASVEGMLGEKIDEGDSDGVGDAESGDVESLGREFVWESAVSAAEEVMLKRFFETLEASPIPHTDLEGLRPDDYLRFLLERWLGASPTGRVADVKQAFGLLERFVEWAERTQGFVLAEHLSETKRVFLDDLPRLQSVSEQLSISDEPQVGDGELVLMEIVTGYNGALSVLLGDAKEEVEVGVADPILDLVREHDFLVGGIVRKAGERASLSGMVLMVPAALAHLLG